MKAVSSGCAVLFLAASVWAQTAPSTGTAATQPSGTQAQTPQADQNAGPAGPQHQTTAVTPAQPSQSVPQPGAKPGTNDEKASPADSVVPGQTPTPGREKQAGDSTIQHEIHPIGNAQPETKAKPARRPVHKTHKKPAEPPPNPTERRALGSGPFSGVA
jgi:hypothetical protein